MQREGKFYLKNNQTRVSSSLYLKVTTHYFFHIPIFFMFLQICNYIETYPDYRMSRILINWQDDM